MTSISSALTSSLNMRPNLFSRIDANTDGKVTQDEFISSRPEGVSESQASELFGKIDTAGTGAVTEEQFSQGMAANRPSGDSGNLGGSLSSETLAAILQLVQQTEGGTTSAANGTDAIGSPPSVSEMFSRMDTDGNGSVSKEEFLAAKPKGISEDQALALYDSIDTEGSGSITSEQFEESMKAGPGAQAGAGAPPSPPGGGGGSSATETYDTLDTNQDGVVSIAELMAGLTEQAENSQDSASSDALTDLLEAIQAYASYNNIDLEQTPSLLTAA